ncbi:hypothetical protein [Haploplasma axanthum]|nr:hypothetical protein [Haploplasma axanthum]
MLVSILVISFLTFLVNFKDIRINVKVLTIVLSIVMVTFIVALINSEGIYDYLIFWIALFTAYLFFISIPIKKFIDYFVKIMTFTAVFSVIAFMIQVVSPQTIERFFPLLVNTSGVTVYNLFFTLLYKTDYILMNPGFFWEPGAYQTFLLLALFFIMFVRNKVNYVLIGIYIVTIITTVSTAGYFALVFLLLIFVLKKFRLAKSFMLFLILVFLFVLIYDFIPSNIQFRLFNKLFKFFDFSSIKDNPIYESTVARIEGILFPIRALIKNPIFGLGFNGLSRMAVDDGLGLLTATQFNWFGYFGFFMGLLLNYPLWLWSKYNERNKFYAFLIFIFFNLIIISENYNRNGFFILILLYGFSLLNKEERREEHE